VKQVVGLAAGALFAFFAPPASADKVVAHATAPSFANLPAGHVAPPPRNSPKLVAGREAVAGFVVVPPPPEQQQRMARYGEGYNAAYLFPDPERARQFLNSRSVDRTPGVCFTEADPNAMSDDDDSNGSPPSQSAAEWSPSATSQTTFQWRGGDGQAAVHAVHSEAFVLEGEGRGSLRIVDAWVDPRTRGVRLIGRSTLPLVRIFSGPNGLELYAARDGTAAQVVVRAGGGGGPDDPARAELLNLAAILPDGSVTSSDCGHMRFMLRPSPGDAQMATLQSVAFLRPFGSEAAPSPLAASVEQTATPPQDVRRRLFQLSVSASQSTVDPRPVLSIAIAWLGRAQRDGEVSVQE
jgi:hypothetical protein